MRKKVIIGVAVIVIVVTYNLVFHRHVLPEFLIFPDPNTIGKQFAQAVITGNEELALDLTDHSPECEKSMLQTLENFSTFEGSDVKDIVINAYKYADEPSDGFIDLLVITNEDPLDGIGVRLSSNYTFLGKRFSCGNDFHDLQDFK